MTLLRRVLRSALMCALLCFVWHASAQAQETSDCRRLVGGTISCTAKPAGDAPPNTERAEPSAPPSESLITRLVEHIAEVPETPPATTVELLDTTQQANFESGRDQLTPVATAKLDALIASLHDGRPTRVLVTAHTDSQRPVRYAKAHFKTNQRLSEARAARVVEYLQAALHLPENAFAIRGFGASKPLASNATKAGRARNRRAEVSVWLEHTVQPPPVAPPPPPPPVPVTVSTCLGDEATQIAPVRITVDGVPVDKREGTNEADRQRCVDVALARADIQVRYDPLEQAPFLNVIAIPQTAVVGQPVRFTTYTNYPRYIAKAEMRVFESDQSTQQKPLAVIPVAPGESVEWMPPAVVKSLLHVTAALGMPRHVNYLLRVYDREGHFDETRPRRLDLVDKPPIEAIDIDAAKLARDTERLAYGENTLVLRNIPVHGGAVTVSGSKVPPGDQVTVMGMRVPVDDEQHFVARQIMPGGPQQVNVKILNERGEGLEFTRNLTIATDDSFFVGLADITAGTNGVSGPIDLVSGDPNLAHHDYVNGQLAFYYKGLIKGQWMLTAAADTQDQPLRDLFSNFSSKDPEYLLRRIDPDKYYPVYGDDSTTVQDAPTSGKFYVRLEKGDSSVLWGSFKTTMSGTDFIQYARTLYGLDLRYRSPEATSFGEKKTSVDAFWADPGTLGSRQEFRGTGGSVYYLQYQDVSVGSEQIWVQVRDKDSGLVMSSTMLVAAQDYDMNYMQGRILLHDPLPATANAETLVHSGGLDGDPVYLVVTYEYVPDFSSVSSMSLGGHASEWFGDHLQLGLSSYHQGDVGEEQDLRGIDGTWRYAAGTYVKAEYAHSDGAGTPTLTSITGGLSFETLASGGGPASAQRVEAAVDLSEVTDSMKGKIALYDQNRDANFSGPGQIMPGEGAHQAGGAVNVPLDASTQIIGKYDSTNSETQTLHSGEAGVEHKIDDNWKVAVGTRVDDRENAVPNASPILSQNGQRTDVALTVGYQPATPKAPAPATVDVGPPKKAPTLQELLGTSKAPWDVYGFVQDTVTRTGDRPENDRAGVGGSYQLNDAARLGAEASDGSMGLGGKLSTDYKLDAHSNVYVNYTLAADQPDALNDGRAGTLTTGTRYRYDDATSVYGEERMQSGTGPDGLTNAYGVDFKPNKQWNYGLKFEKGTVSDPLAGDMSLTAIAATAEYTRGKIKYGGALEWRDNDSSISGASRSELVRNSLSYQVDPDWRLFGKLNWSQTQGQASTTLNAEFHEFILGAAWRPILDDRWNVLFKYTNLNDQPSESQLSSLGNTVNYAQQSQVEDIDATYQMARWLSLGVKYAIRTGELKQLDSIGTNITGLPVSDIGTWYYSQTQLWIVRADLLFPRQWDAMLEFRRLSIHETEDERTGLLVGGYRHLNDHFKIGAGYNFTNYSDDLTDLSYRAHGFFLDMIGKY
jgi:outer membrane protein OmpA-like peptidoglycan-associated protein